MTLALDRSLDDWTVDMDRLPQTAEFVGKVVRDRYPTLHPPFHARWRHDCAMTKLRRLADLMATTNMGCVEK